MRITLIAPRVFGFAAVLFVENLSLATAWQKSPVPSGNAMKEAQTRVTEVFASQIKAAPSAAAKSRLVVKLLKTATNTASWTESYALLLRAEEQSILAGDARQVMNVVDRINTQFQIDVNSRKTDTFSQLAAHHATRLAREDIREVGVQLIRISIRQDRPQQALQICKAMEAFATRTQFVSLKNQCHDAAELVKEIGQLYRAAASSLGRPNANRSVAVANYWCLGKADWKAGLFPLSKSQDAALADVASQELESPTSAIDQTALADKWWNYGQQHTGLVRQSTQRHAVTWYKLATSGLKGLDKERVEYRIAKYADASIVFQSLESPGANRLDLLRYTRPERDIYFGSWKLNDSGLVSGPNQRSAVRLPYIPPAEYNIEASVERLSGQSFLMFGVVRPGSQFAIILDGSDGTSSGVSMFDKTDARQNILKHNQNCPLFQIGKRATVSIQVRSDRLTVKCNNTRVINFHGDIKRFSMVKFWAIPNTETLFLRTERSEFKVHTVTMTPISGPGHFTATPR